MKEKVISFETAVLAKIKRFDIDKIDHLDGIMRYAYTNLGHLYLTIVTNQQDKDNLFLAPTQSLLQKWLRDNYDIHILPMLLGGYYDYNIFLSKNHCEICTGKFKTYEEALEIGLIEGLKLIKN